MSRVRNTSQSRIDFEMFIYLFLACLVLQQTKLKCRQGPKLCFRAVGQIWSQLARPPVLAGGFPKSGVKIVLDRTHLNAAWSYTRLSSFLGTLMHFQLPHLKGGKCIITLVSSLGVRSISRLRYLRCLSMRSHNCNLRQLLPSVEANIMIVCLR